MPEIQVTALKCSQCGHVWMPRSDERPLLCPNPKCRSMRWDRDTPAKNKRKPALRIKR